MPRETTVNSATNNAPKDNTPKASSSMLIRKSDIRHLEPYLRPENAEGKGYMGTFWDWINPFQKERVLHAGLIHEFKDKFNHATKLAEGCFVFKDTVKALIEEHNALLKEYNELLKKKEPLFGEEAFNDADGAKEIALKQELNAIKDLVKFLEEFLNLGGMTTDQIKKKITEMRQAIAENLKARADNMAQAAMIPGEEMGRKQKILADLGKLNNKIIRDFKLLEKLESTLKKYNESFSNPSTEDYVSSEGFCVDRENSHPNAVSFRGASVEGLLNAGKLFEAAEVESGIFGDKISPEKSGGFIGEVIASERKFTDNHKYNLLLEAIATLGKLIGSVAMLFGQNVWGETETEAFQRKHNVFVSRLEYRQKRTQQGVAQTLYDAVVEGSEKLTKEQYAEAKKYIDKHGDYKLYIVDGKETRDLRAFINQEKRELLKEKGTDEVRKNLIWLDNLLRELDETVDDIEQVIDAFPKPKKQTTDEDNEDSKPDYLDAFDFAKKYQEYFAVADDKQDKGNIQASDSVLDTKALGNIFSDPKKADENLEFLAELRKEVEKEKPWFTSVFGISIEGREKRDARCNSILAKIDRLQGMILDGVDVKKPLVPFKFIEEADNEYARAFRLKFTDKHQVNLSGDRKKNTDLSKKVGMKNPTEDKGLFPDAIDKVLRMDDDFQMAFIWNYVSQILPDQKKQFNTLFISAGKMTDEQMALIKQSFNDKKNQGKVIKFVEDIKSKLNKSEAISYTWAGAVQAYKKHQSDDNQRVKEACVVLLDQCLDNLKPNDKTLKMLLEKQEESVMSDYGLFWEHIIVHGVNPVNLRKLERYFDIIERKLSIENKKGVEKLVAMAEEELEAAASNTGDSDTEKKRKAYAILKEIVLGKKTSGLSKAERNQLEEILPEFRLSERKMGSLDSIVGEFTRYHMNHTILESLKGSKNIDDYCSEQVKDTKKLKSYTELLKSLNFQRGSSNDVKTHYRNLTDVAQYYFRIIFEKTNLKAGYLEKDVYQKLIVDTISLDEIVTSLTYENIVKQKRNAEIDDDVAASISKYVDDYLQDRFDGTQSNYALIMLIVGNDEQVAKWTEHRANVLFSEEEIRLDKNDLLHQFLASETFKKTADGKNTPAYIKFNEIVWNYIRSPKFKWNEETAKIIELYADKKCVQAYRAKRIGELLKSGVVYKFDDDSLGANLNLPRAYDESQEMDRTRLSSEAVSFYNFLEKHKINENEVFDKEGRKELVYRFGIHLGLDGEHKGDFEKYPEKWSYTTQFFANQYGDDLIKDFVALNKIEWLANAEYNEEILAFNKAGRVFAFDNLDDLRKSETEKYIRYLAMINKSAKNKPSKNYKGEFACRTKAGKAKAEKIFTERLKKINEARQYREEEEKANADSPDNLLTRLMSNFTSVNDGKKGEWSPNEEILFVSFAAEELLQKLRFVRVRELLAFNSSKQVNEYIQSVKNSGDERQMMNPRIVVGKADVDLEILFQEYDTPYDCSEEVYKPWMAHVDELIQEWGTQERKNSYHLKKIEELLNGDDREAENTEKYLLKLITDTGEKNLRNLFKGCDVWILNDFPDDAANYEKYKNSYIVVKNEVFYVQSDGKIELSAEGTRKSVVTDFNLFSDKLKKINPLGENKIYLSEDELDDLITSNGNHIPVMNSYKAKLDALLKKYAFSRDWNVNVDMLVQQYGLPSLKYAYNRKRLREIMLNGKEMGEHDLSEEKLDKIKASARPERLYVIDELNDRFFPSAKDGNTEHDVASAKKILGGEDTDRSEVYDIFDEYLKILETASKAEGGKLNDATQSKSSFYLATLFISNNFSSLSTGLNAPDLYSRWTKLLVEDFDRKEAFIVEKTIFERIKGGKIQSAIDKYTAYNEKIKNRLDAKEQMLKNASKETDSKIKETDKDIARMERTKEIIEYRVVQIIKEYLVYKFDREEVLNLLRSDANSYIGGSADVARYTNSSSSGTTTVTTTTASASSDDLDGLKRLAKKILSVEQDNSHMLVSPTLSQLLADIRGAYETDIPNYSNADEAVRKSIEQYHNDFLKMGIADAVNELPEKELSSILNDLFINGTDPVSNLTRAIDRLIQRLSPGDREEPCLLNWRLQLLLLQRAVSNNTLNDNVELNKQREDLNRGLLELKKAKDQGDLKTIRKTILDGLFQPVIQQNAANVLKEFKDKRPKGDEEKRKFANKYNEKRSAMNLKRALYRFSKHDEAAYVDGVIDKLQHEFVIGAGFDKSKQSHVKELVGQEGKVKSEYLKLKKFLDNLENLGVEESIQTPALDGITLLQTYLSDGAKEALIVRINELRKRFTAADAVNKTLEKIGGHLSRPNLDLNKGDLTAMDSELVRLNAEAKKRLASIKSFDEYMNDPKRVEEFESIEKFRADLKEKIPEYNKAELAKPRVGGSPFVEINLNVIEDKYIYQKIEEVRQKKIDIILGNVFEQVGKLEQGEISSENARMLAANIYKLSREFAHTSDFVTKESIRKNRGFKDTLLGTLKIAESNNGLGQEFIECLIDILSNDVTPEKVDARGVAVDRYSAYLSVLSKLQSKNDKAVTKEELNSLEIEGSYTSSHDVLEMMRGIVKVLVSDFVTKTINQLEALRLGGSPISSAGLGKLLAGVENLGKFVTEDQNKVILFWKNISNEDIVKAERAKLATISPLLADSSKHSEAAFLGDLIRADGAIKNLMGKEQVNAVAKTMSPKLTASSSVQPPVLTKEQALNALEVYMLNCRLKGVDVVKIVRERFFDDYKKNRKAPKEFADFLVNKFGDEKLKQEYLQLTTASPASSKTTSSQEASVAGLSQGLMAGLSFIFGSSSSPSDADKSDENKKEGSNSNNSPGKKQ